MLAMDPPSQVVQAPVTLGDRTLLLVEKEVELVVEANLEDQCL